MPTKRPARVVGNVYGFQVTPKMERAIYNAIPVQFELCDIKDALRKRHTDDLQAFLDLPANRKKYNLPALIDRIADRLTQRWKAEGKIVHQSSRGHWDRVHAWA